MAAIQTATSPLFLIKFLVYTALILAILKTLCISHFWIWMQIPIAIYTANVIKL